jgi:hypothetical protein
MDDPPSHGLNHCFGAVVHAQLFHDVLQVRFDGFGRAADF